MSTDETIINDETDVKEKAIKPDSLPEKFWDDEAGEVRVKELISSYNHLEKKLSEKKPFMVPESADEYDIKVKDDLFEADPALNARLLAKGFTSVQVQEVYDLAVEHLVPLLSKIAGDYKADREVEKLVNHFGGFDQWEQTAKQLKAYGEKNFPKETLQAFVSSYDGVIALHKIMMQDIGDGMTVTGKTVIAGEMRDINAMMNNPKYWRDKDPAYIAKVTEAFSRAYD